ncbi:MAG TPA: GIY-YIG nuclease family protein [Planctomycetota bacterium]|nr:GIY-YIG nuclease family protein [Planctomycetota bacterium]
MPPRLTKAAPAGARRPRARVWSLYLVRRADGALYTGIALDVATRLEAHAAGNGAKALRGRGPLRLVLTARIGDRAAAQRAEALLKRLGKADKEALTAAAARARRWFRCARIPARALRLYDAAPASRAAPSHRITSSRAGPSTASAGGMAPP